MAGCSSSFDFSLKEGHNFPDFHVMDGLVQGSRNMDSYTCNAVILNLGREALSTPKGLESGTLTDVDQDFTTRGKVNRPSQNGVG